MPNIESKNMGFPAKGYGLWVNADLSLLEEDYSAACRICVECIVRTLNSACCRIIPFQQCMGYGMKIPAHQVGGLLRPQGMGYEGLWVNRCMGYKGSDCT